MGKLPCLRRREMESLAALLPEDLTPDELSLLQTHVASCLECAEMVSTYRKLQKIVKDLPNVTPLHDDLLDRDCNDWQFDLE